MMAELQDGWTLDTVAGVDEAGRGPLAGPVVAAAVILATPIDGLDDSKKLAEPRRDELALRIRAEAVAWCVASASVPEIDELNILHATMLAMRRAVAGLAMRPGRVLVDGNRLPDLEFDGRPIDGEAIVGGDGLVPSISAASILAKTTRDAYMRELDAEFPQYGFAQHKGYGTRVHRERILAHGPCPEHRMSFAPMNNRDLFAQ